MTTLIRAASLSGFEELATECGLDVPKTLRRVGLTTRALRDPDGLISYFAMMQLLECAARESGRVDFGQQLSLRQGLPMLGPIAVLMEHVSTVGEAFELGARYIFVHSPAIQCSIEPVAGHPDHADLGFAIEMPNAPPCAQTIELSMGVMVRVLEMLGEGNIRPIRVAMPHARMAEAGTYRQTYGCVCTFEQAHATVRVHASALARPLHKHNNVLRKMAQDHLDTHFTRPGQAFAEKVRGLVREYLSAGLAAHQPIAEMLAVHVRTMQNRLSDEGTTFEVIKDEVRRETFERLLAGGSTLQLSQVAAMLDYANQSALTRSCRRWFGVAPSAFLASAAARGSNRKHAAQK